MTRLILATRNEHKVAELRQILGPVVGELGLHIESANAYPEIPDTPETEVSFEGNARLKALAIAEATGLPALADDSGLAVDVLGGCPGIFSARWSGTRAGQGADRAAKDRANLTLLLEQLGDVPDEHRSAAFCCAAVLAMPEGGPVIATEGRLPGRIIREPMGENGFGYDPVFVPEGEERTLAQHSEEEKNAISHRGRAFRRMVPYLAQVLS